MVLQDQKIRRRFKNSRIVSAILRQAGSNRHGRVAGAEGDTIDLALLGQDDSVERLNALCEMMVAGLSWLLPLFADSDWVASAIGSQTGASGKAVARLLAPI